MGEIMTTNEKPAIKRIKVLQYMHGDLEYFHWSEKINRAYCGRHGYDYVVSDAVPREDRHVVWQKIEVILNELHGCDYLLFVDADAFFYSHELRIEEELIPLMDGKSVLMAADIASEKDRWTPKRPNSGVILAKPDDDAKEFFEYWNSVTEIDKHIRWKWPPTQRGLWKFVMPMFPDTLRVHEEYYLIQGKFGLFIRHLAWQSDKNRAEKMKQFCLSRGLEDQTH
jgi:hypothetical protein